MENARSDVKRVRKTGDAFTATLENYTGAIPSSAYLGVAVGAVALSLACQIAGRGKWGTFIAQWVPTWLTIGIYNKLAKIREDNEPGEYTCKFCESRFSFKDDLRMHQKHCSLRTPTELGAA
jgi:hypothetical protein